MDKKIPLSQLENLSYIPEGDWVRVVDLKDLLELLKKVSNNE